MTYPKISIVTPSYNQGKYLEQTILSVINQNYPNLEYIIMDGGSTDNSVEIIKKYEKHLTYWQSKPDGGQSVAINEGFRHATGNIYGWLNSDDQFIENTFNIVADYFMGHNECTWLSGKSEIVHSNGKILDIIKPKKLDYTTLINWSKNIIYQPSTFWVSELWNDVKGLNENLESAMDFDLWLKFSKISQGHIIDEILSKALFHKKMKTYRNAYLGCLETGLVLCIHGEFDLSKKLLARPLKRIFELDRKFSVITNNKIYRYLREKLETRNL